MKIQWSGLGLTEGRGRIGGNIASRNGSGAYLKKFTNPINPQSTAQQAVRAIFAAISSLWRALTQAQRDDWNTTAPLRPQEDSLGNVFFLSGFGLFSKYNNALQQLGIAGIDNPVALGSVTELDDLTLTIAQAAMTMTLDWTTPQPVEQSFGIFATAPLSAGNESTKQDYKLIQVVAGDGITVTEEFSAGYNAVFGAQPSLGERVTVRATPIIELSAQEGVNQFPSGVSA